MKISRSFHINREKSVGLAAALLLHVVAFTVLCRYHIILPPTETLKVFVRQIQPTAPAKIEPPTAPMPSRKTPPQLPDLTQAAPPAPLLLTSSAPVVSPVEPVAPPPPAKPLPPAAKPAPAAAAVTIAPLAPPARPVILGDELSVNCLERTPPSYPKQSIRLGEQGRTVLQVELDESGTVVSIFVKKSSGYTRLDEAAISAVKDWRCTPAQRNGIAVRSTALQPFNFTLKGR